MQSKFIGEVKTLWETNHRDMELLEAFAFIEPSGKEWAAPAGSLLKGATIPRALWTIVGSLILEVTGGHSPPRLFRWRRNNDDVSQESRQNVLPCLSP